MAKLTQAQFAQIFDVSVAMIKSYESGKANPDRLFVQRLTELTDISPGDLQNVSLKESDITTDKLVEKVENEILTASEKSIRKPKIETNPELEGIIYVPISAQAGYSKHYLNPVFVKSLQKIFIPGMPYRGDKYRIFEVDGESMEPTLKHGYHVLGELIEKDSYAQVPNYYVYVIVTEDRVMLKRLYRKSNSEFVAISDNEEFFPQFGLHMGDIKELWLVKRKMDWEMAPPKKFEIHI